MRAPRWLVGLLMIGTMATSFPGSASAKASCGSTYIKGHRFTYEVTYGPADCASARYALAYWIGAFPGETGYPPGWTCFNAHGDLLTRQHEIAHCYQPDGANPVSFARLFDPSLPTDCGTITGEVPLYGVSAVRTSCYVARGVARSWLRSVLARRCSRFACRTWGFACRARPPARVNYRVSCTSGVRRVWWDVSAD